MAGYAAFNRGDILEAARLATQCLTTAARGSYWRFGALGLRCWALNFLGDRDGVERDARTLLAQKSGPDKPWFDGLALVNLGLVSQQAGEIEEAKEFFSKASDCYRAHRIDPDQ